MVPLDNLGLHFWLLTNVHMYNVVFFLVVDTVDNAKYSQPSATVLVVDNMRETLLI